MKLEDLLKDPLFAGLPVENADDDADIREAFADVSKAKEGDDDLYEAVVSTSSLDRDNEIVDVRGMDVEWYKKNPVICWSHQWGEPPVGSAKAVKAASREIRIKFAFASTAFAQDLRMLVDEGHLRTMSVGMIGVKSVWNSEEGWDEYVAANKRHFAGVDWAKVRRVLATSVMAENSLCTIPANPDAMLIERVKAMSDETQKMLRVMDNQNEPTKPEPEPTTIVAPRLLARLVRVAPTENTARLVKEALDIYRGRV